MTECGIKVIKTTFQSPIWRNEVVFYDTLMNKMQAIRKSIGQKALPFPKCFYASDEVGVIVLENLKSVGFKTVPKSAEGNIFVLLEVSE